MYCEVKQAMCIRFMIVLSTELSAYARFQGWHAKLILRMLVLRPGFDHLDINNLLIYYSLKCNQELVVSTYNSVVR